MLEVNDFNAIKITLASPEKIKSWSYGEVTKPETINYRTLRPEKDGLFCEKIFGPTKDWECYCGKYKRVRYKGIICDKCGVEVARAKVRRERMGHIELSAPVSHIWFVKGTPSRVGLLLDISPRSLERVLYFAQYVVISVDDDERVRLLVELEQGNVNRIADIQQTADAKFTELNTRLAEQRAELTAKREEAHAAFADRLSLAVDSAQLAEVRELVAARLGLVTEDNIVLATPAGDLVIVPAGVEVDSVAEAKLARVESEGLRALVDQAADEIRQEGKALRSRLATMVGQAAGADVSFYGDVLVRKGDSINPSELRKKVEAAGEVFRRSADERREQLEKMLGTEAPDDITLRGVMLIKRGVPVDQSVLGKVDKLVARWTSEAEKSVANLTKGARAQSADEEITLRGTTVVREGAAISPETLRSLDEIIEGLVEKETSRFEDLERQALADQAGSDARYDADIDLLDHQIEQERSTSRRDGEEKIAALRADIETQKTEVEEIKRLDLLNEGRYRELHDRYPLLFRAGMGAEAVREIVVATDLDKLANELRNEIRMSSSSGQRRKKATKRLRVVEAFRKSGNKPEWMILTVLPVLPPDLRPMVQLDGGRFATSDLNDLYRRVINRNNRLKRLLELGAPEIIIRNEKRMLQEAVDSLIDNGRRGRAVAGSSNHKLKSLSDMLKGKQGRFRQNLLGKRVDYSGRSVIIVGPTLKLHQCGLPKKMALELFKPFVMRRLVERGFAHNIKSAKRIVERVRPEVWDILEEVIQDHPVLLNRAPTLHRLGIQAFEPVLIDGSAIQIHPLVCSAFGADFDGDQMAVHVPLSIAARREARTLMLSSLNLLSPASGEPTVAPTLDMVLGCYYMTVSRPGAKGSGTIFGSAEEARLACDIGNVHLQAPVRVRIPLSEGSEPELVDTTVGRVIFNASLPVGLGFRNQTMGRKQLRLVVGECYRLYGSTDTAELVNVIKDIGFKYATRSGITIAVSDLTIPKEREGLLEEADKQIDDIQKQYRRGLITDEERYTQAVDIWQDTTDKVTDKVRTALDQFGPVFMMTDSGAKGNIQQLRQMAGMRGLMTAPNGKIIELPIRSSFREGLSVLEYFISTHGARKGLADTAIRTADSGYLTRRLIDVAQDVIVYDEECGTTAGIWIEEQKDQTMAQPLKDRIVGRLAASALYDPETGEIIVDRNESIDEELADRIVAAMPKLDPERRKIQVRSPLTCQAKHGICQRCYGRSLARGHMVEIGEAVGIIAAESIGEPGTQLTMRTFHTGGVAGADITSGLPRVEELFEARVPKGLAVVSEIDGVVGISRGEDTRKIKISSAEVYRDEQMLPQGAELLVNNRDQVDIDTVLARTAEGEIVARMAGAVEIDEDRIAVVYEDRDEREYQVPHSAQLKVENGQRVNAGDLLTEGAANPQDILRIKGREQVQLYMVEEVQRVYRSQGVAINDKHIETIVRQLLRKVRVDTAGDTDRLPGELVDRFEYEDLNAKVLAEGGEPATAQPVLLGVTKASLNTKSWLAAASFQETTRVLTEAAIQGSVDRLVGLKENVIIGKLIPAGTGLGARRELARKKAEGLLGVLRAEQGEIEDADVLALLGGSDDDEPDVEALETLSEVLPGLVGAPIRGGRALRLAGDDVENSDEADDDNIGELSGFGTSDENGTPENASGDQTDDQHDDQVTGLDEEV